MRRIIACFVVWTVTIPSEGHVSCAPPNGRALAETNLVRNPDFEEDADGDGVPDHWRFSGDRNVTQTLAFAPGRDGKRSARLTCTKFSQEGPASHAMICQMGVPVRRGKYYRVAFWARGEDIACDIVSVALSDTSVWTTCGLEGAFAPTPRWERYEFVFRATRDCPTESRFQIWFHSTGTLWIDDVEFEEGDRDLFHPGHVIPSAGLTNLVPNASFECGTGGWGSAELDRKTHWGGSMNRLFGELDQSEAFHGRSSLRIGLSPESQPVSYFDYYELYREPILAPAAANLGFLEVEPKSEHTFSVYMKAQSPDTPAVLAVRQFQGGSLQKPVRVSTEWQRYTFTFTPTSRWCYVLAGPDLRQTKENPNPPAHSVVVSKKLPPMGGATIWLDAVQLEQGGTAGSFTTRLPVEFSISTDKPGNVFGWDESLRFRVLMVGDNVPENGQPMIEYRLLDFFDREVARAKGMEITLRKRRSFRAEQIIDWENPEYRGAMQMRAKLTVGDIVSEQTIRLAVIPVHQGEDSRFGVNHAYPWPHLLDLCRKAGLVWVRDWSCKWQQVEPEKGRFTFTETDYQIDRPLEHDLSVLGLLPFPSSHWSSGAPADYKLTTNYVSRREHVAYAPRDEGEFENYVARTVSHYRDRIRWWQVFNEPVFTSYSLPRKFGYDAADYARWTKAFARAARRADPQCRVLAGMGYLREGEIMDDWKLFLQAGGLDVVDAVDIHHYPRLRPPEYIEKPLQELGDLMEKHGGRKPIWLTEYGYYADDEPWSVPMPNSGFNMPLISEQLQAEYAVRWAVIMLAGGVDKIFYHAGTCDGINHDSLQGIFYEYAGTPHKIYAAQAVLAHLFTPTCRFVKRLPLGDQVRGYLFRDGQRSVGVVWTTDATRPGSVRLTDDKIQLWDMMGRPQAGRQFTPSGTPVYLIGEGLSDEGFEAGLSSAN